MTCGPQSHKRYTHRFDPVSPKVWCGLLCPTPGSPSRWPLGERSDQLSWLGGRGPCKAGRAGSDQTRRPWELVQTEGWSGSEKGARKGAGGRAAPRPGMWLGHRQLLPKTRIAWGLHNPHLKNSDCPLPTKLSWFSSTLHTPAPTLSPSLTYITPLAPSTHSWTLLLRPHSWTFQQTTCPRPTDLLTPLTP